MPLKFSAILQNMRSHGLRKPAQGLSKLQRCATCCRGRGNITISMLPACSLLVAEGSTLGMNSSLTSSMLHHITFKSTASLR